MQKLLSRRPSGPILCTATKPCLGFLRPNNRTSPTSKFILPGISSHKMPSAGTALQGGCSALAAPALVKRPNASTVSCRICICNVQPENPSKNAWAVFKERNSRFRVAWLRAGSHRFGSGSGSLGAAASSHGSKSSAKGLSDGGDENGAEVEKSDSFSKEKPVRVQSRRSRESSVLLDNPDLLAIPGVGPRNLRKLVEKGIAGVAELKQLYRDKVQDIAVFSASACVYMPFVVAIRAPLPFSPNS